MIKRLFILFFVFFCALSSAQAAHLVGGEMSYKCMGNNNYEVSLVIYRDCFSNGAPFDPFVVISIYKQNGVLFRNDSIQFNNIRTQLPIIAPNNCTTLPQTVCTEKATYKYTVNLPPTPGGYTITHQRCCRNNTITNINNVNSDWGSTFSTSIPSMDTACNSSPKYKDDPPVVLCLNVNVKLDLGVTEPDGDSIYYELCNVLNGGANAAGSIAPNPAAPPPYSPVPFIGGYSSSYPISSSPAFTINHQTGQLSGRPNMVGQFVFAICAREYRNGILISTNRRDFQFNVSPDCQTVLSKIRLSNGKIVASPTRALATNSAVTICSGGEVSLNNASTNASSFFWDFGDSTTLSDTSRLGTPSYTYPDTGTYVVMLVVEPYTSCADTAYAQIAIYDLVNTSYTYNGEMCFANHSINFVNTSNYSADATFLWDFGGNTSIGTTSTLEEPTNVVWDNIGAYYVELTVDDFGCSGTYGDTIYIYPNPIADEIVDEVEACLPYNVQFFDNSLIYGKAQHFWYFGDGYMSNDVDPVHTYMEPGTYTVTHKIYSLVGCIDSSVSVKKNVITVRPVPESGLIVEPTVQSIYNPLFILTDNSANHTSTTTYLPKDKVVEDLEKMSLILEDTGVYAIIHVSENEFGCTDSLIQYIEVYSPFNLFMPNAFTPDGDGINDIYSYTITGVESCHLEIYNRWGEIVFKSDNPYETWNGRLHNVGPELTPGVYPFVMKAEVERGAYMFTKNGVIHLVR